MQKPLESSKVLTMVHFLTKFITFSKKISGGETIIHNARIITHVDTKKSKLISLLANDMDSDPNDIIAIYRQRWEIELLFKQIKQSVIKMP